MNPMTSADPMVNSVFMGTPQNAYTVSPGGTSQVPLYPNYQPQVQVIHGNPPGLGASVSQQPAQRALKEGKVLGAIQILIGLVHFSIGSVMATVLWSYITISFYRGFPFWGGILFIMSGSFSVSAEKYPTSSGLLNGSCTLNIISAISSLVGIILLSLDLIYTNIYITPLHLVPPHLVWFQIPGMATSGVLLIFCLLEFCIASAAAHFGLQLFRYKRNNVGVVYPNIYVTNPVVIPEPVNSPPSYSEVQDAK
ncbi:membrane-spanning 4-domains subfamily A member 8-like [Hippopotamus amphibius kiboko]|uniref:membrane-spanning 4-domains subfamily A member 8-like n=1 Tax=Hippopotamus amphibius kiboko TaxID=575201 RepID=UPI002591F141|nr:membrane-spanning 4-domains subfamily A member 8-like [Hippopotamus amphibius kiboko]